jgi:CyaY protein
MHSKKYDLVVVGAGIVGLAHAWMAAKSGGYHYKFKDGQWQDTKGQGEFFENLSRFATAQSGTTLKF